MTFFAKKLRDSALLGFKAGLRTWWWISKMTVLATLLVVFLQWGGVIDWLSDVLAPFFSLLGLSGGAVLVFLTGALANIYAAIGVMATLSIEYREALILAVMALICHNMIVETIIQRKSGANAYAIVLLRISMALVAAVGLNLILPDNYSGSLILDRVAQGDGTLAGALKSWSINMATMLPIMFALIVALNTLQYILREFKLLDFISKTFAPLMLGFGLAPSCSLIWLVLNTLGLAYGGSIMIAEKEAGTLQTRQSKLLNTHIALSHSLIEDTLLFVALGLPLFWLVIPRLILSIICVWIQRWYYSIKENKNVKIARQIQ